MSRRVIYIGITIAMILIAGMANAVEIKDIIDSFIRTSYPWSDIEISGVKVYGKLPDQTPDEIMVERGPLGKSVFVLKYKDGKIIRVRANVSAYENVIKSKRPFRKGHVIQEDDIYLEKIDVRRMPGSAITDPLLILGKPLKRSITANVIITENMIQNSKIIKRGRPVTLIVRYKGMTITAQGKLKEKAYVGSVVRAINLSSRREVTGVLIDENTVEIRL